ncbi:hypothetical protein QR680_019275 [Steinernema hermaphroditum]|uniref:SET domain-containing protein n=1 Tax=Steinernema hermaphroditum TaxID=289476 RepID=A0AA39HMU5_9BILA|nr:hypothetical protein QR680_019275 [Steinernema hermaphroditum]
MNSKTQQDYTYSEDGSPSTDALDKMQEENREEVRKLRIEDERLDAIALQRRGPLPNRSNTRFSFFKNLKKGKKETNQLNTEIDISSKTASNEGSCKRCIRFKTRSDQSAVCKSKLVVGRISKARKTLHVELSKKRFMKTVVARVVYGAALRSSEKQTVLETLQLEPVQLPKYLTASDVPQSFLEGEHDWHRYTEVDHSSLDGRLTAKALFHVAAKTISDLNTNLNGKVSLVHPDIWLNLDDERSPTDMNFLARSEYRWIALPIVIAETNHCAVAIVDAQSNCAKIFDSRKSSKDRKGTQELNKMLDNVQNVLSRSFSGIQVHLASHRDRPTQQDNDSCGMHVLETIKSVAGSQSLKKRVKFFLNYDGLRGRYREEMSQHVSTPDHLSTDDGRITEDRSQWSQSDYAQFLQRPQQQLLSIARTENVRRPPAGTFVLYDLQGYKTSTSARRLMNGKQLRQALRDDGYEWKSMVYSRKLQYAQNIRHVCFRSAGKEESLERHELSFDYGTFVAHLYKDATKKESTPAEPQLQENANSTNQDVAPLSPVYSTGASAFDDNIGSFEKQPCIGESLDLDLYQWTPRKQRKPNVSEESGPLVQDEEAGSGPLVQDEEAGSRPLTFDKSYDERLFINSPHVEEHSGQNCQHYLACDKCDLVVTRKFADHVKGHGKDEQEREDSHYYKNRAIKRNKLLALASVGSFDDIIEEPLRQAGYVGEQHDKLRMVLAQSLENRGFKIFGKVKAEAALQGKHLLWKIVPSGHAVFAKYDEHFNLAKRREGGCSQYRSYVLKAFGYLYKEWFVTYPGSDGPQELTSHFIADHAEGVVDYLETFKHLGGTQPQLDQRVKGLSDFFRFFRDQYGSEFKTLPEYIAFDQAIDSVRNFSTDSTTAVVSRRQLKNTPFNEYMGYVYEEKTQDFIANLEEKLADPESHVGISEYNRVLGIVMYTTVVMNIGARNEAFYKIRREHVDLTEGSWLEMDTPVAEYALLKPVLFPAPKSVNFSHHCLLFTKRMWRQLDVYVKARDRMFPLSKNRQMYANDQPFFVNSAGRQLFSSTVSQLMKSACKFKGAPFVATMNDVRHAAAADEVCRKIMNPDLDGAFLAGHSERTRKVIYADQLIDIASTKFVKINQMLATGENMQSKSSSSLIKPTAREQLLRIAKKCSSLRVGRVEEDTGFGFDLPSDCAPATEPTFDVGIDVPFTKSPHVASSDDELESLSSFKSCIEYDEDLESFSEEEVEAPEDNPVMSPHLHFYSDEETESDEAKRQKEKPDLLQYLEKKDLESLPPIVPYVKSAEVLAMLNWEIEGDLLSSGFDGYMSNSGIMSLLARLLPTETVIGWNSIGLTIAGTTNALDVHRRLTFMLLHRNEPHHHWALAVHDRIDDVIRFYDSVYRKPTNEMAKYIKKVARTLNLVSKGLVVVENEQFQQQNGYDCGIYAILVAQKVAQGAVPVVSPQDAKMFREEACRWTRKDMFAEIQQDIANHNAKACNWFPAEPLSDRELWTRRTAYPVQKWEWLAIMPRRIGVGRGIRAKCDIPKGSIVCDYFGYTVDKPTYDQRMERLKNEDFQLHQIITSYAFERKERIKVVTIGHNIKYDSVMSLGRLMNHSPHKSCVNVTPEKHFLSLRGEKHSGPLTIFKAIRRIKAGEELLWNYGANFNDLDWPHICPKCQPSPFDRTEETGEEYREMDDRLYKPWTKEMVCRAVESIKTTDTASIGLYGINANTSKLLGDVEVKRLQDLDHITELVKLCEGSAPTVMLCGERREKKLIAYFFPGKSSTPRTSSFHIFDNETGALVSFQTKFQNN